MNIGMALSNPARRRLWLTTGSGALIALALLARFALGLTAAWAPLMIAAALLAGSDISVRAWSALRVRHLSIELLVTIAAAGALVIGEYWEAAAVTFLFMLGAWLESRTMRHTRGALAELIEAAPSLATVLREGESVEIPAHQVRPGEVVVVRPGGKIPVDGTVVAGAAAVDESAITGEPIPAEKAAGARVYAGTITHNGLLRIEATGIGADTTLARIIRRVEEAQEEKAPTQRLIERFAAWYTPAIIALAVIAFLTTHDLHLALTLLVVGCPGALVISTPVSVVAGIGRAARSGILIKGGQHLEGAGRITAFAMDKTGTLTEGRPRLVEVVTLAPSIVTNDEIVRWAAIAESGSDHPLGRPIIEAALAGAARGDDTRGAAHRRDDTQDVDNLSDDTRANDTRGAPAECVDTRGSALAVGHAVALPSPEHLEEHAGMGLRARFEGREIMVGSRRLLERLEVDLPADADAALAALRGRGRTPVLVAVDGVILGILGLADTPRPSAAPLVARLREEGVGRVVMLTGDDSAAAHDIAARVGIDEVHAELLPEQKLEWIRRLRAAGHHVAMAGDGINDAPALAEADTSIAMGAAGSDVAIETADIALMTGDLGKIAEAVAISRATLRNMRQNLVIALLTAGALLGGVMLGRVHMAGGMLIHQLSVLAVIVNGMRLGWRRRL